MADAAVLFGGYLVKTTGFSNTAFNHRSGFLIKFKLRDITYVHVNKVNFRSEDQNTKYASAGYYDEANFLKYLAKQISNLDIAKYILGLDSLEKGEIGDKIHVRKLNVTSPYTDFCKVNDTTWSYAGGDILDSQFNIIIPPPPTSTTVSSIILVHAVALAFYQHNISLINSTHIPGDKKEEAAYLVAKMALQIDNIQKNIFPMFSTDAELNSYIISQNIEWTSADIFFEPTLSDLASYLNNLTAFYNSLYANQIFIRTSKSETKLYWLGYVLSENALKIISAYDKIKILDAVAKGTILGELSRLTLSNVNEEVLVIKLIKSTAAGQEDDFLNGLVNTIYPTGKKNNTLFQILYDKINDSVIGEENLKIVIEELHKIWLRSSLYPYNADGTVKDNLINPTIYAAKPIYLGYESGTILGAFNTSNYDFFFNGWKIDVIETIDQTTEYGGNSYDEFIGSYGIYQTITLKNTDSNDSNTKFLSVNIDGNSQAAVPIFYLKYIDDKKRTENLVTQFELAFDLVLTLTGIGNIAKLRHIRTVFKLGRVALELEAAGGGVLATYELAQGVVGVIEVTSSLASIFINYSKNYKNTYCDISSSSYDLAKCNFYTNLDTIFLVMQLFSGPLDYVTSRQLKKAAEDLLSNPLKDDLDPAVVNILQKFAGDFDEIKEVFRVKLVQRFGENSPIWQKLTSLTEVKQNNFLVDFGKAHNKILDALNVNNGELIFYWDLSEDLIYMRKLPDFLLVSKRIYSELRIDTHYLKLDIEPKASGGFVITGGHQETSIIANLPSNYGLYLEDVQPLGDGYRRAKVKVSIPGFGLKAKKFKSVLLPESWSVKKIKSEIAYAMFKAGNPKNIGVVNRKMYDSFFSDGTPVQIILIRDFTGNVRFDNILVYK